MPLSTVDAAVRKRHYPPAVRCQGDSLIQMAEAPGVEDDRFIAATVLCAEAVLEAREQWTVYDAANAFGALASKEMSDAPREDGYLPQFPTDLYLIWAALTDLMDAPGRGSPAQNAEAVARMKRAASEWLVCAFAPEARATYIDRWKYVECGYDRQPSSE